MLRFTGSIMALGVMALQGAAHAQSFTPVAVAPTPPHQPLAPGEVMLTVSGKGQQISTPDFASITLVIICGGGTNDEAMANNRKQIDLVRQLILALGVEPAAIQMQTSNAIQRMGFVGNEDAEGPAAAAAAAKSMATSSMMIRFTDMAKLAKARQALQSVTTVQMMPVNYGLNDDSSARRAAVDQALAKAKANAAIYAKAMNMRIDRVVTVTDTPPRFDGEGFIEMMAERGRTTPDGVRTDVRVEIAVILKPL